MTLAMIDQASFQGHYWTAAHLTAAHIEVVAVKATEGTGYVNPDYGWQVGEARAAGCVVMHYHLIHPELNGPGAEVAWFHRHAQARPGDLVAYDCEPQFVQKVSTIAGSAWVKSFSQQAWAAFGHPSVVCYTPGTLIAGGWLESVRGIDPLWYASPGANPASPPVPARPWELSFLQYGVRGQVATDADCAYFGSSGGLEILAIPAAAQKNHAVTADGSQSLIQLATPLGITPAEVLWLTAANRHFGPLAAGYIDAGQWSAPMPKGMIVWLP